MTITEKPLELDMWKFVTRHTTTVCYINNCCKSKNYKRGEDFEVKFNKFNVDMKLVGK